MDFEALNVILKRSKKKVQQQAVVVFVSRLYATVQLVGSVKLLDVGVDPNNLPNIGDKVIIQRPNEKQDWIITSTFTEPRLGSNVLTKGTNLELINSISLDTNSDYIYLTLDKVYAYLQLALGLRSLRAGAATDSLSMVFNEDTTAANYQSANGYTANGTWTYNAQNSTVGYAYGMYCVAGNTSTANVFAQSNINIMAIPGQYVTWNLQAFQPVNHPSNPINFVIGSGYYKSSVPITSIKLSSNSAVQLATGSTAYLFAM